MKVEIPLQAYFRINAENMGQFERTLIIADKGSRVHYIEGCTAPIYSTNSLHSAVVELIALEDAYIRYTTIQNWSNNIYNLVTKRAVAHKNATVEWVDGNIGSQADHEVPVHLPRRRGRQGRDPLGRLRGHGAAPGRRRQGHPRGARTRPRRSPRKSISKDGGRASYRGLVKVHPNADGLQGQRRSATRS